MLISLNKNVPVSVYHIILDHIGDLKSEDVYGNVVLASTNSEKAEMLGKFFESVFVKENDSVQHNLHLDPASLYSETLYLVSKLYLKN